MGRTRGPCRSTRRLFLAGQLLRLDRLFVLELGLLGLLLLLLLLRPPWIEGLARWLGRKLDRSGSRPRSFALGLALATLVANLLVATLVSWPVPKIHDEFSYLLAADTFLHGRVSNPSPEGWKHFETFHELMRPSYASKYPPGQGLSLALGRLVFGAPIWGCWLIMAAFVGSTYWCFRAWLPSRWAVVGGLLALVRFAGFGAWSQSYWGGGVAALGGTLVLGALPRLWRRPCGRNTAAMAIGFVLMAHSRPFEGLLLSLPLAAALLWRCFHPPGTGQVRSWLAKVLLPILVVQILNLAAMGCYNRAVTGEAMTFPFQRYQQDYVSYPLFVFQERPPLKAWRHWVFALDHHAHSANVFPEGASRLLDVKLRELRHFADFFLGLPLLLPFAVAFCIPGRRAQRRLLGLGALVGLAVFLQVEAAPRKFAPAACLPLLIAVTGLRHLSTTRRGTTLSGKRLATMLLLCPLLAWPLLFHPAFVDPMAFPWGVWRQAMEERLEASPGKDLVFCSYRPERHFPHFEWVYNDADMKTSPVIWARDLGGKANGALVKSYGGRKVWRLDADGDGSLVPYLPDGR